MKRQKTKKLLMETLIFVAIFMVLIAPALSFAYKLGDPLVPACGTAAAPATCGWTQLLGLINNVITFLLKYMAIPISAIMFAYAGFLLVTAGGEAAHAREKAKSIFMNAALGLIIAAAAWLIIKTLLSILGYKDASWVGF